MPSSSEPYSQILNLVQPFYESLRPFGPTLTLLPPNPLASTRSDRSSPARSLWPTLARDTSAISIPLHNRNSPSQSACLFTTETPHHKRFSHNQNSVLAQRILPAKSSTITNLPIHPTSASAIPIHKRNSPLRTASRSPTLQFAHTPQSAFLFTTEIPLHDQ